MIFGSKDFNSDAKRSQDGWKKVSHLARRTIFLCFLVFMSVGCTGAPGYRGEAGTPFNFNGERFSNLSTAFPARADSLEIWRTARQTTEKSLVRLPLRPRSQGVGPARAVFINHATVLVEIGGYTVLTDPLYSDYAGPWRLGSPKRGHAPGIAFDDLPPIDLVILSHDHFDHLDIPTLRRLEERDHPTILAGLGTASLLSEYGLSDTIDLAWFEAIQLEGLRIVFLPAEHGSRRSLADGYNTLWGSFLLKAEKNSVYFAGDTGWGDHFDNIRFHYGAPDLALLPLRPKKGISDHHPPHIYAEQAVLAHLVLGATKSMAIHFGTLGAAYANRAARTRELEEAIARHHVDAADYLIPFPGDEIRVPSRHTDALTSPPPVELPPRQ